MKQKDYEIARKLKQKLSDLVPLIFTRDEIENSPLKASPIVKNILAEGMRI